MLGQWNGGEDCPARKRLQSLQPLAKEILVLRKSEHTARRLTLEENKLEFKKSASRQETPLSISPSKQQARPSESSALFPVAKPASLPDPSLSVPFADSRRASTPAMPPFDVIPPAGRPANSIFNGATKTTTGSPAPLDGAIRPAR